MLADLLPQLIVTKLETPEQEKFCSKCDEWKPHSAFSASNRYSGGMKLQRWCRTCQGAYRKSWRPATPVTISKAE